MPARKHADAPAGKPPRRETDLYRPIHDHLIADGWTVRSEVLGCDLAATRGGQVIAVELKLSFNATLLVQAVDRQKAADSVYVAIPRPMGGMRGRSWRGMLHLLKRLELGLLVVALDSARPSVTVVHHPRPLARTRRPKARSRLLAEIGGRSHDGNVAGSNRRRLLTAYRETALHIACRLDHHGTLSPRTLRAYGTGPKTTPILYQNVYGWFERQGKGLYGLGGAGRAALTEFPEVVRHYRERILVDAPIPTGNARVAESRVPAE